MSKFRCPFTVTGHKLTLIVRSHYAFAKAIFSCTRPSPLPPGVQILSSSCSFWEILAKSCVVTPLNLHPPRVGTPISGKSWIRHWGVLVFLILLKILLSARYCVKFVLGRFSHFNIAIAYSNSTFCGA